MLTVKDTKAETIRVRVTEQEKEFIKEEAAKRKMSMSDFIKVSIMEYLKKEK